MTDLSDDLFGDNISSAGDNNAGNMRSPDGAFQSFDSPQAGVDAMRNDLLLKVAGNSPAMKANYGQNYQPTLSNIISTWAPPTENDTDNYINYVSQKSGINPDEVLSSADVDKIIPHMITMEHGASAAKQYADAGNISADAQVDSPSGRDLSAELFSNQGNDLSGDFDLADAYTTDPVRQAYQSTMNTVAKPINNTISKIANYITPSVPTSVLSNAQDAANSIDSTKIGQWLGDKLLGGKNEISDAGENIKDLESYNPDLSQDLSAFGENAQLAGNLGLVKPASELAGAALGKIGDIIADAGASQAAARKSVFVQDLITPKVTPTVAADQFSRSTEAPWYKLSQRIISPTPQEAAIADTVTQLPVSPNKSLLANYNIISDANSKEADNLIANLKANDVPVDLGDIQDTLTNSVNKLRDNPYITGDGESSALKVVNVMNKAILDNADANGEVTASSLLQARKDFDNMIKQQKGGKIFDPTLDSPTSIAVQNMRQAINDLVESKVPNIGYKQSLQKQSNLYRAMDNIEEKGALEAPNMIKRAANKVVDLVPGKSLLTKGLATTAGLGAATAAPVATGLGLAGYGGYKAVTSPITKRIIGNSLQGTGKILGGYAKGGIVNQNPTEAQKKAGNYKKAHIKVHGLNIAIENPRGSLRSGKDKDGKAWSVKMPDNYGYIKGTKGADKDHVDVYVGESPSSGRTYVVNQIHPHNGKFDEHKILIGYNTKAKALEQYKKAFSDGSGGKRIGSVVSLPIGDLKKWLKDGNTGKKLFASSI